MWRFIISWRLALPLFPPLPPAGPPPPRAFCPVHLHRNSDFSLRSHFAGPRIPGHECTECTDPYLSLRALWEHAQVHAHDTRSGTDMRLCFAVCGTCLRHGPSASWRRRLSIHHGLDRRRIHRPSAPANAPAWVSAAHKHHMTICFQPSTTRTL